MVQLPIYMDHHATTPVEPRVLAAMLPYFTEVFGNAASKDHEFGYQASHAVEQGRAQVAALINARPDEIIFTSGATESDNLALFGVAERYADKGDHIITCVTEHKAVLDAAKRLESQGKRVTYLRVNQYGQIDLLSLSAHKMYGPKGIGALYVRRSNPRVRLAPMLYGGGHERGMRSGTLNVPGIVGFGAAAEIARRGMKEQAAQLRTWTEQLFAGLQERIAGIARNGHPTERLPHNLNVYITGVKSRAFIAGLKDLAIATGSACTSASVDPSHVIMALGFGEERAHCSLRFGLGRGNAAAQVQSAVDIVARRAEELRAMRGA